MKLLDRPGFKPDPYRRIAGADIAGHPYVLVPFADLGAALMLQGSNRHLGVEIANTVRLPLLIPYLEALTLIAIIFPAFSDGRGFSLARQLRDAGYKGVLRAVGPLIADQFAYAVACGFDEVELPDAVADRQPRAQWITALGAISLSYQRGYTRPETILEKRRAALKGGA